MAIHSSILAWRIAWTEEPSEFLPGENCMDRGVHGVTKSLTWLSDLHFHFQYFIGWICHNLLIFIYLLIHVWLIFSFELLFKKNYFGHLCISHLVILWITFHIVLRQLFILVYCINQVKINFKNISRMEENCFPHCMWKYNQTLKCLLFEKKTCLHTSFPYFFALCFCNK